MDVRTNAINGFLFHVADAKQIDKVFAYLKHGYVYFGFNYGSGNLVLMSNIQINDGEWHQVSVIRSRGVLELFFDGVCGPRSETLTHI